MDQEDLTSQSGAQTARQWRWYKYGTYKDRELSEIERSQRAGTSPAHF